MEDTLVLKACKLYTYQNDSIIEYQNILFFE